MKSTFITYVDSSDSLLESSEFIKEFEEEEDTDDGDDDDDDDDSSRISKNKYKL